MSAEVLVVGAGPAGSVAALQLARAGVRVRLLERARFPRDKLCGDTINPGTLALLDALGAGGEVRRMATPVSGMIVGGPRGASVVADYPRDLPGAALRRSSLDQLLLEMAARAGASVEEGVIASEPLVGSGGRVGGVRCTGAGRPYRLTASMVIAADGRRSRLASALGLLRHARTRRWAFGACFTDVAGMTSRGEMHIRTDGYIGLAALPGGAVNVCVVRDFTRRTGAPRAILRQTIDEAVKSDSALSDRFHRAQQVSPLSVLGPLGVDATAAGVPGLLLAGDAAGFVDPMTGDGLRFAIRGGELAAAAALGELAGGHAAHAALAAARRDEFAQKSRFNRALRWLTSSRRGVTVAALLAGWWDAPFEPLIRVAGDCALARRIAAPSR